MIPHGIHAYLSFFNLETPNTKPNYNIKWTQQIQQVYRVDGSTCMNHPNHDRSTGCMRQRVNINFIEFHNNVQAETDGEGKTKCVVNDFILHRGRNSSRLFRSTECGVSIT